MKKICVYTCITGAYDDLKEIKNIEPNVYYYCFTNNKNIKSSTWNVVYIKDNNLSDVVLARKIKILGHKLINDYDIQVWMDAAVEFKKNIRSFVDYYLTDKDVFVGFKHEYRNSIKEEMNACLRFRKENIENVKKLQEFYNKEKYNYQNGLIESTVIIKRNKNDLVMKTMKIWFNIVKKYSKRDQLSFNYAIFKTGMPVKWINEKVFKNSWFKWYEHLTDYKIDKYMIYYGNIDKYDYIHQVESYYKKNKKGIYEITEKVPCNTDEIYIELTTNCYIKYLIKDINFNYSKIKYYNTVYYGNDRIFFQKPGFIIIKGNFKKGDKIKIKLQFWYLEEYERIELLNYLAKKINTIESDAKQIIEKNEEIQQSYDKLFDSYNKIINSKLWKVFEPLRKIKRKMIKKEGVL